MTFVINPETVVVTLRSMLEQQNSRMTLKEAVHALAAKGVVLPGETAKDQVQILNSLVSLCEPSFLNVRPGKGGGVGVPAARPSVKSAPAKPTRTGVGSVVQGLQSQADSDEENDENQQTGS